MTRLKRNREYLKRLSAHIEANPDTRFWQALRNMSGVSYILTCSNKDHCRGYDDDTFYWEGFTGRDHEQKP